MPRHTWRHCDYHAICQDCGWESFAKNALGNAAQHHDKTGHTVNVETAGGVTYCGDAEHERRTAAKQRPKGG